MAVDTQLPYAVGSDPNRRAFQNNVNAKLAKAMTYQNHYDPVQGLVKVRQVLAYFGLSIPRYDFMEDSGTVALEAIQWGAVSGMKHGKYDDDHEDVPTWFVHLNWHPTHDGMYVLSARVRTPEETAEIARDYEDVNAGIPGV